MAEAKSVGASIDSRFDDMERKTASLREELDEMRKDTTRRSDALNKMLKDTTRRSDALNEMHKDTMRRFDALDQMHKDDTRRFDALHEMHKDNMHRLDALNEKVSSIALELKNLGHRANAHSKMLDESVAKAGELLKSVGLLQTPLESLVKVRNMARGLEEQYGKVQEEVSRQKELQVIMLEQHNDLRLTVHRQQPFVNTVPFAAAPPLGGTGKSTVCPVSASSPTMQGNTSPIRFPDEPGVDEENRKRTAFARNSASFDTEAIDSNAMRADSVPASLKRRKAKQDLKAGHGRHSSESGILYEQQSCSDGKVAAAAQVQHRVSRELPLQSPGTRKILEALESGREDAEIIRAARTEKSTIEPIRRALNSTGQLPATEHPATPPLPARVPESPATSTLDMPLASTQQPAMEVTTSGPRRSTREPKKRMPSRGEIDPRKLKPGQLSRPLTEEEIENARP
ncbi:hypothetical protein AC578_11044 [Pseudocercospora eumusae]|uniref:Uncharacterized protein n=1 Tax=Pseudocercospora eumusae TaxID=321146 RepID=A0A139HSL0_9PEZI|nr:hypothetical protein AC578_11044 [Pseudocercospora eumusae]